MINQDIESIRDTAAVSFGGVARAVGIPGKI